MRHLFPAHAGVILIMDVRCIDEDTVPRTRGGDPAMLSELRPVSFCSPHTRG